MLDEPAIPRLGERHVGGGGARRTPAVDDQDQQVGIHRGGDGARAGGAVPGRLAVGARREAGNLDELGVLEPINQRLVDARSAEPGLDQRRVALTHPLECGDQARLARSTAADDGDRQVPHLLLERMRRPHSAAGQPAILVGADDEPAAIELDQVGPKPIDVGSEEPPQEVLLHAPPRRLDHQLLGSEPHQAGHRAEKGEQIRINVARFLDIARGLDRRLEVRRRDQVAPGDLAAKAVEVLGGQLQGREQLDDRHVFNWVLGERMIMVGELPRQRPAGAEVDVNLGEDLHRDAVALLGRLLDEGPCLAVLGCEGPGHIPIERRQDRLRRLRPAPRAPRTQCRRRSRPRRRSAAIPAPLARALRSRCKPGSARPVGSGAPTPASSSACPWPLRCRGLSATHHRPLET